jgi:hypothetical protein
MVCYVYAMLWSSDHPTLYKQLIRPGMMMEWGGGIWLAWSLMGNGVGMMGVGRWVAIVGREGVCDGENLNDVMCVCRGVGVEG